MAAAQVSDLLSFIDSSPSPYHVVQTAIAHLTNAGFVELDESQRFDNPDAACFVKRAGSLVAWRRGTGEAEQPIHLIGAHTDSPNLRIKPQPDRGAAGYRQLGVEIYGGALLNSWLDRDLGLSGRVAVQTADGIEMHLLHIDRPLLRIPQLAIHLDREINSKGLLLNRQTHMQPVWGLGETDEGGFVRFLASELDVSEEAIVSWDVMPHDLTPSAVVGLAEDMIAAPRLDNQLSCWAGLSALTEATSDTAHTRMLCLFDHEEVGSTSRTGADSSLLPTLIERIITSSGGDREAVHVALARSLCVSADGAHATHPNYADRHEPQHQIELNGGPVVKINANERYATTADSHAAFVAACEAADVPFQRFVNRTDLACGSTIGPITSARLGISTVDAGVAQLAMHSARETAGALDPPRFAAALGAFLG